MKSSIAVNVAAVIAGIAGVLLLYYMYNADRNKVFTSKNVYSGRVTGPLEGRLKYINIISLRKPDCLDNGFYLYFSGVNNEDFVIVTGSVRESFGDMSENIVGYRFRFEKLLECRRGIENIRTFLLNSPPVMLDKDD